MGREVNETQPFSDKVVKLIPTEIVGAYMVLSGILGYSSSGQQGSIAPPAVLSPILIQVVFFVLLLLTPIYLLRIAKVSNKAQLIVTTISFVVWIYTLGGPFVVWDIYSSLIGAVVLVLWTLIIPLFVLPISTDTN
jgi:hypothetical protein